MRLARSVVLVTTALLLVAPTASAVVPSPAGEITRCALGELIAEDQQPCPEVARFETTSGTYYVSAWIYKESNGCEGLQNMPGDCDGDGAEDGPDDFQSVEELSGQDFAPTRPVFRAMWGSVDHGICLLRVFIGGEGAPTTCGEPTSFEHDGTTYHVSGTGALHTESNGCAGLQERPSDCDGDGDVEPRDHRVTLDDYA